MTTLNDVLVQVASQLGLNANELIAYADEDTCGGYHPDPAQAKWPVGSIWEVEGQVLYALIRALKPGSVLELGTYHGCSATHILAALKANGKGTLVCVDDASDAPGAPAIGHLIPDDLRDEEYDLPAIFDTSIEEFIARGNDGKSYDFIFEDAMHTAEQVETVWEAALNGLLNPGGVIVSHDALHFMVGKHVSAGVGKAMIANRIPSESWPFTYLIEPSDCGLAIWQKPKLSTTAVVETPAVQKPVRKRKAK